MKAVISCAMVLSFVLRGFGANAEPKGDDADILESKPDSDLPMGPILLGSMGLVALAVGAGFGWQAYEENEDFNQKQTDAEGAVIYPLASEELADDIEAHALTANVLMFGGLAAAIGSMVWWLVDDDYGPAKRRKAKRESSVSLRPMIGRRSAGFGVRF